MQGREATTRILQDVSLGRQGVDALLPHVYADLKRLAQRYLREERDGHTLQATALVHEAYLRLIDQERVDWRDRAHFFAVAAQAMRRILIDHARHRNRQRRGGGQSAVPIEEAITVSSGESSLDGDGSPLDLLALDIALTEFAELEPEKARVVEMRIFSGLTIDEVAVVLNVSPRTVKRHWQYAQAWLFRRMTETGHSAGGEA